MTRLSVVMAMLLLSAGAAGADTLPVQNVRLSMTLALAPDKVLPGVPVSFRVTLTNLSNLPADVPQALRLRVERDGGDWFYAWTVEGHSMKPITTVGGWPTDIQTLGSKGAAEIEFAVDSLLAGPEWFVDPRLSKPGVYRLQLIAYSRYPWKDEPKNPYRYRTAEIDENDEGGEIVRSNVATLTIREPEGEDAVVWAKMQALAGEAGWQPGLFVEKDIAAWIWKNHPTSYYQHYTAGLASREENEFLRSVRAGLAIDPNGPHSDWLRLLVAGTYARRAHEATYVRGGDFAKATENADLAASEFRKAAEMAKTPQMREKAEQGLAAIPDRAQLKELCALAKKNRE